jgi:hypothetical protein
MLFVFPKKKKTEGMTYYLPLKKLKGPRSTNLGWRLIFLGYFFKA